MEIRNPIDNSLPAIQAAQSKQGRLDVGRKDVRFWPAIAEALDLLEAHSGRVADAAAAANLTTANFVAFLQTDPKVWQRVNELRQRHGQKPLR